MKFDLHLHSTASDGTDSPEELIAKSNQLGFQIVSLTDHDTVSGVRPATEATKPLGIRVIPGVEISAGGDAEVHVLGYGLAHIDRMQARLFKMRAQRDARMREMIGKLNRLGIQIHYEAVAKRAQNSVGRAHLAQVLVEYGHARDVKEAFERYLASGRPAYVPREKLSVYEAIGFIREAGGLPVIAHPGQNRDSDFWIEARLKAAMDEGLAGLEVYHPAHTARQCAEYRRIARRLGLLITGGSDYHGQIKTVQLGDGMEGWNDSAFDLNQLIKAVDALGGL